MVRAGEIEHGQQIAHRAESVWNWASPAGKRRARRRAELMIRAAGLRPEMKVLELGCGTGLFTRRFAAIGCHVVAVDVSAPLLEHAAARRLGNRVDLRLEDAEDLSFDNESFDAVLGSSILHHLDIDRAFLEIHRVLKHAGRIAFAEPNMLNPQIALQRSIPWLRRLAGESPEETAYVRWSLTRRLLRSGFEEVSVLPFDFLHPATPPRLIRVVHRLGALLESTPGISEIAGSLLIRGRRGQPAQPRE